jgi:NAD(P)-dependent dehydrogenase (short-subunit alcohol dehydrogenase family)
VELSEKNLIITGGGSGLGAATGRLFAESGAKVVLCDINGDAGEEVAASIGDSARFVKCNVTDEGEVQATVDAALDAFGPLHGAVNCAGIGGGGRVVGRDAPYPLEDFKRIVDVNLFGSFNVIRLVGAAMMETEPDAGGERGVFINTASAAAFEGQIGQAAYSASKGGLVGMTLPIAREFAQHGIRVLTIAPGLFKTPMMLAMAEDKRALLSAQVPFPPRLGEPEEYALLAKQMVENSMLNGTTIRLDGAIRMQPK